MFDEKVLSRFWSKVQQSDGCWTWAGTPNRNGYGRFWDGSRVQMAHRFSYTLHFGSISERLDVDHRCHDPRVCSGGATCPHRLCVNPDHLKAVTRAENAGIGRSARAYAESCRNGHPMQGDNIIIRTNGDRLCRTCDRARARDRVRVRWHNDPEFRERRLEYLREWRAAKRRSA